MDIHLFDCGSYSISQTHNGRYLKNVSEQKKNNICWHETE